LPGRKEDAAAETFSDHGNFWMRGMTMNATEAPQTRVINPSLGQPPLKTEADYREALRLRPDAVGLRNDLGNILGKSGRYKEAVFHYRAALELRPDLGEIHDNLGIALKRLGRIDEAREAFETALRLKPDLAGARINLAVVSKEQGDHARSKSHFQEAVVHLRESVRLRPDLARSHADLAYALAELGRFSESAASYRRALWLQPRDPESLNNLGNALRELGQLDEAESCTREAIRLFPAYAEAHGNLGNVLAEANRLAEAQSAYAEAIRLRPNYVEAHGNLGNVLADSGQLAEADAAYAEAIRLQPDYAEAHLNRSFLWLAKGDYDRGFAEYEWRWKTKKLRDETPRKPPWSGDALDGRTILLRTEQGFGDTFQFIRYAPLVKASGGRVLLECEPALMKILEGVAGVDALVPIGSQPAHDVQRPLMSLPLVFGTTLETIPASVPYLFAKPGLVDHWRGKLAALDGFKVGIAWQGNPKFKRDRGRSIPLAEFEPLAKIAGVRLIGLQKGSGADQVGKPDLRFDLTDLGPDRDEAEGAFVDTAAIMMGLDLVITSDSAIAHLAGALGVPVWVALGAVPDWRWMLDRDDCPWYPTMRLFRRSKLAGWNEPLQRMADELQARLKPGQTVDAVPVLISPGELVDKITILEIKRERFDDPERLQHVEAELSRIAAARDRHLPAIDGLTPLAEELKRVNESLWEIENEIRRAERDESFGPRFIELARSVGRENGRRADLKRQIDRLLGASVFEQKLYC
jgi:Flp pilus assembly protein TadD